MVLINNDRIDSMMSLDLERRDRDTDPGQTRANKGQRDIQSSSEGSVRHQCGSYRYQSVPQE